MTTPTKSSRSAPDAGVAPVVAYVRAQISAIREGDAALRRGEDPIHATRVAIRRLRSTLRAFADAFDPGVATGLDEELSWYAGILGHVRDHEVQRARFAQAVADLPDEWVLGPVAADIETTLAAEQRTYRADVDTVLTGDRYAALISALATLDTAVRSLSRRNVTSLSNKADKKARTRLKAAIAGETGDDEALHRARKAFKRARYAADWRHRCSARSTPRRRSGATNTCRKCSANTKTAWSPRSFFAASELPQEPDPQRTVSRTACCSPTSSKRPEPHDVELAH